MLTIPASVKTLFKTDGVKKNFRVMFPNGERNDITSDNIVTGSVAFTESVCSQDVLKFGCIESSVLEFETVGIENIIGKVISAGWEIDLSSLTDAQRTTIQNDPGDGVYVPLADSDLGFPYYRVPAGVFTVQSCPRNHGAMTHRKITATNVFDSPIEYAKQISYTNAKSFTASPQQIAISAIGFHDPSIVDRLNMTKTATRTWAQISSSTNTSSYTYQLVSVDYHIVRVTVTTVRPTADSSNTLAKGVLSLIDFDGEWPDFAFYNQLMSDIYDTGLTFGIGDVSGELERIKKYMLSRLQVYSAVDYSTTPNTQDVNNVIIDAKDIVASAFLTGKALDTIDFDFAIQTTYTITVDGVQVASRTKGGGAGQAVNVYQLTDPNASSTKINIPQSGRWRESSDFEYIYAHDGAYTVYDLTSQWAEINGWNVCPSRKGGWRLQTYSTSSPVSVGRDECAEVWWADDAIAPVDTIIFPYRGNSKTQEDTYTISVSGAFPEYSVYDLRSNGLFDMLTSDTNSVSRTLISTYFEPAITGLTFTPADAEIMNRPDIEAGDYLAIDTEDGTVYTFITRQTIKGEQLIRSSVESVSGIVEGVS